jgi:hypothetical protein
MKTCFNLVIHTHENIALIEKEKNKDIAARL